MINNEFKCPVVGCLTIGKKTNPDEEDVDVTLTNYKPKDIVWVEALKDLPDPEGYKR